MACYDRANWHSGGNFPKDLPHENGGTHIGMFLAWAIMNGLEGDMFKEDDADSLAAVRSRKMTGRDFLFECADETLASACLNDEGNAFAADYYDDFYSKDCAASLSIATDINFYRSADSWENFDRVSKMLDQRFKQWKTSGYVGFNEDITVAVNSPPKVAPTAIPEPPQPKRPWWRFW